MLPVYKKEHYTSVEPGDEYSPQVHLNRMESMFSSECQKEEMDIWLNKYVNSTVRLGKSKCRMSNYV